MTRKVGIFAGSFDPIHSGHLRIAEEAMEQAGLEKVFFLVEPRPRRKQGVKALGHRVKMVELALKSEPAFGLILLEQARFTLHDTLPILRSRFKGAQLYLIMGDDVASHLAAWPHISELTDIELIIAARKHSPLDIKRQLESIKKVKGLNFRYGLIDHSLSPESSSQIRAQLRKNQIPDSLPKPVYDYLKKHGLYASSNDS